MKGGTPTDAYTAVFIAAWYTKTERQKKIECLLTDDWINKDKKSDTCYMDKHWKH